MTSNVSPVPFTTVAQSIPPNVFADMDRKVTAAVAGGADVIDLAKGNPDAFPADFIREVAKKGVDDPANAVRWQAELPQGGAGVVSQYV